MFEYTESRAGRWPTEWFGDYEGNVQADACAGCDRLFATRRVTEFGCMAHARRRFLDALELDREACLGVLAMIRELYVVEHAAERKALVVATERGTALLRTERCAIRRAARQEQAVPVLERLKTRLDEVSTNRRMRPKSPLREAVQYMRNSPHLSIGAGAVQDVINQWAELTDFLDDAAVSQSQGGDNNACEREMKRQALNRKKVLFPVPDSGSEQGGRTAAILTSCRVDLTSTCRRHDIDPQRYLTQLLVDLPGCAASDLAAWLPDEWKRRQPAA